MQSGLEPWPVLLCCSFGQDTTFTVAPHFQNEYQGLELNVTL